MRLFRRLPLVVFALVVVGAVSLVWLPKAAALPPPSAEPYPIDTFIAEMGIRLTPVSPGDAAKVTQADAVVAATRAAGGLADASQPYSVQLTRLTDERYGPNGGDPIISNRLAWLVRFTGTPQPAYGPRQPERLAMELNVVIDAATGSMLEAFSYR